MLFAGGCELLKKVLSSGYLRKEDLVVFFPPISRFHLCIRLGFWVSAVRISTSSKRGCKVYLWEMIPDWLN